MKTCPSAECGCGPVLSNVKIVFFKIIPLCLKHSFYACEVLYLIWHKFAVAIAKYSLFPAVKYQPTILR